MVMKGVCQLNNQECDGENTTCWNEKAIYFGYCRMDGSTNKDCKNFKDNMGKIE